ncbi:hypothetical protein MMC07_001533 [Pseudocyphellaria aurata]|nr:hypothetical protein [Pseudocyphellaria aurata]
MASHFHLLRLPVEIRNRIYGYSFNWPDIEGRIHEINEAIPSIQDDDDFDDKYNMLFRKRFAAPTILLLNRQIYVEAMAVILTKPMTIPLSLPSHKTRSTIPVLRFFVPRTALNAVKIVKAVIIQQDPRMWWISHDAWKMALKQLACLWYDKTNLESFTVEAPYGQEDLEDDVEWYMDQALGVSSFDCILFFRKITRPVEV